MKIAAVIASLGRPAELHETVRSLLGQTKPPEQIVLSVPGHEHVADQTRLFDRVRVVISPPGLPRQRNEATANLPAGIDIVAFFDDDVELRRDYLAIAETLFAGDPDAVVITGKVLADGKRTGPIGRAAARRIVQHDEAAFDAANSALHAEEQGKAYGCNMLARRSVVDEVRFDEAMPAYAWLEDLDFVLRCSRFGRIYRCENCRMVHLGTPTARASQVHIGFQQIMNPFYMWRKGSISSFLTVLRHWCRAPKNLLLSFWSNGKRARRQRLIGNMKAFRLLLRGQVRPEDVLTIPE